MRYVYEITHPEFTSRKLKVIAWGIDQALGIARHHDAQWDKAGAANTKRIGFAKENDEVGIQAFFTGGVEEFSSVLY